MEAAKKILVKGPDAVAAALDHCYAFADVEEDTLEHIEGGGALVFASVGADAVEPLGKALSSPRTNVRAARRSSC